MKITTVDTVIDEFRSEYIPLFPHSSVELLVREIERLKAELKKYKRTSMTTLIEELNKVRDGKGTE